MTIKSGIGAFSNLGIYRVVRNYAHFWIKHIGETSKQWHGSNSGKYKRFKVEMIYI